MTTTLLLVDLAGPDRTLSRLLLTVEGRAADVLGVATVPGPVALLWLEHPPGRLTHITDAVRRIVGVRGVVVAGQVPVAPALRHRTHVGGVVDVTVELEVAGRRSSGAGDGATLLDATTRAVAYCLGCAPPPASGWLTTHPHSGAAVAVLRGTGFAVHATAPTPEVAALAVAVAGLTTATGSRVRTPIGGTGVTPHREETTLTQTAS